MAYNNYYASRGSSIDAYRASPLLHRPDGGTGTGGGRVGRPQAGGGRGSLEQQHGPEIYGFTFTEGLPGFEGSVAAATLAPAHGGPAAAAEAGYLALLCHEGLSNFRQTHSWDRSLVPAVETALRTMAQQHTPSTRELQMRLQAMARLKELARSGIHFCVGLDLEPYGSFVSGLYTPTGDLDLSIEGHATWQDEAGRVQRVTVDSMEREMKVKFLRALASRIQAKRLSRGQVERILHARVPILKFRDVSGLDFDVGIGGSQALFKSTVLGLLALHDWRFGALVRLVKLWARHYDVNDSANGSLNSFALTLLVVFHLQTRSPAVLPPLCQLFGQTPSAARPMQEGNFPDWNLLSLACDHLSHLSRQGGPSPGGANSETLLELLASFFALYEGLLSGGWAARKGADAGALRGVLRRVRVDTWGARLRHERWDKDGYCCSIEDPFDSTDNCARTVRHEDKLASIADAVAAGRQLLLELEQPHHAELCLQRLFGPSALHPRLLHDLLLNNGRTPAVQCVPAVDLIIPPRIQAFTNDRLPHAVHVDHCRQRGVAGKHGGLEQVQHQLELLTVSAPQQQQQRVGAPLKPPPPPGLRVTQPAPAGLAPSAAVPGMRHDQQQQQQQQQPAFMVSLQHLRQAMEPGVAEEAARLAELEHKAAAAAAVVAAAREERRAAKKAAAKAARDAKAEERRRARAERGRSRSGSRSRSQGSSRSRSRRRGSARAVSPALSAAMDAAAAAVSNLGHSSSMSAGAAGAVAAAAVAPAAEQAFDTPAAAAPLAAEPVAAAATAAAAAVAAAAAPAAAADGGGSSTLGAPNGSRELNAANAAVLAGGGAANGSSDGSGKGVRKEKRHGKNMKSAAKQRQEQRDATAGAGTDGGPAAGGAASAPPPGLAAQQQQQQDGPAAAPTRPPQEQQQQPGPEGEAQPRSRGRVRSRGRGQQQRNATGSTEGAPGGPGASAGGGRGGGRANVVLQVPRRQGSGRGGAVAGQQMQQHQTSA